VTSGGNVVIGGVGADTITIGGSGNTVLGDDGEAFFHNGALADNPQIGLAIQTIDQSQGGDDVITVNGDGDNVIFGGSGADTITVNGNGDNVIFGDNGAASYTNSAFDSTNGVLADVVTTGETAPAEVFGNTIFPSSESNIDGMVYGGDDTISVGDGDNVIVGGLGADKISTGAGANIVLGDSGYAVFNPATGALVSIASDVVTIDIDGAPKLDFSTGTLGVSSNDVITLGNGDNVVIGGAGADQIVVGATGANVIIGDDGEADYTNGVLTAIFSTDGTLGIGGADVISGPLTAGGALTAGGNGDNIVIGGIGADTIMLGGAGNTIIGDDGKATFDAATGALVTITTQDPTFGGADTITVTGGNNVIFGGTGGDNILVQGASSGNIVVGDDGYADFTGGVLTIIASSDPTDGGDDVITLGDGNNVVIGGSGADEIVLGASGVEVVIGDNGEADYTNGVLTSVESTDDLYGGDDVISGPAGAPGGSGGSTIIGGVGADTITLGGPDNTVIGDDGKATFGASGEILTIATQDPTFGGDDAITVTGGDNVIFGGTGADTIIVKTLVSAPSGNIILGDDGQATFTDEAVGVGVLTSVLTFIETTDQTDGGDDIIQTGGGDNVIFGGSGADQITSGDGNNVILGDNGEATFTVALASGTIALADAAYSRTLTQIETTAELSPTIGATASLASANQALGGTVYGGDDTINVGAGDNVILGGLGADQIIVNGDGSNVILGDSGVANFDPTSGALVSIYSTYVSAAVGGTADTGSSSNDTILTGNGNNVVFGGSGADHITTGSGADIILGDNGYADFTIVAGALTPNHVETTDPTVGGDDVISSGAGNDMVFGGTGDDTIDGGAGDDVLFGDFASYDASRPANARALSIFTGASNGGGNDTITGGAGNNYIVGGQGNDTIYADEPNSLPASDGDNDIIGDNNTPGGAVGNDTIYGGAGNDVILGDNGQIYRQVTLDNWQAMQWASYNIPASDTLIPPDLIRQVTTYNELSGGNDVISGGDGMDRIFGQAGNDTITDGNGSDEIIGGLGANNITVGMDDTATQKGDDIVIAGEGQIVRALNPNGTPLLNSDGSWHRDVVLEQVGSITGSVAIDSQGHALQPGLAASLLDADMVLLAGSYTASGAQLINPDDNSWQTEALLVTLQPVVGSTVTAGNGNDVIFGTLGNDTITAGDGNDVIFGDRASNTVSTATDIPHIVNGVLITDQTNTSLDLPFNGQLVTPAVNLLPSALTPGAPQIELGPSTAAGSLRAMAQSGNLVEANGTVIQVFASVVPDLIHNKNALEGNDTIKAGNGKDVIFGDYGLIGALPTTGIAAIDAQLQGLSVTMLGLLTQFSALSTAQDALEVAQGTSTTPYVVSAGNDSITVGNGNDTVFGDFGEYLVPGVAFAQSPGTLASNALALDGYLLDMQEVFGDMSYVAHEAGQQVIASFATAKHFSGVYNPAAALRAATHQLDIGNDKIVDGNGVDLIVGDDGFVLMPGVATATSNWATGVSSATLQSVQAQLKQFEATFDAALKKQLALDHPFAASDSAAAKFLFNGGNGFQLDIGNDRITGGAGASILIGDMGLILDPVIGAGVKPSTVAAALQSTMVTAMDRLFLGVRSAATATAASWGVVKSLSSVATPDWSRAGGYAFTGAKTSIAVGNDIIASGAGSDHIYGDMGVVLPQLGAATGLIASFYAYPSGEPGGSATANYNYAYGFGPLGPLQAWRANPAGRSRFTVDADTITGGKGNNVIFGELGDDVIAGGAGNDQISGGWGFNTVSGGGGVNQIAYNRHTDTYTRSGGTDVARSMLNVSASSAILLAPWSSTLGTSLAAGMIKPLAGPLAWTGVAVAPFTYPTVVPFAPGAEGGWNPDVQLTAATIDPATPDDDASAGDTGLADIIGPLFEEAAPLWALFNVGFLALDPDFVAQAAGALAGAGAASLAPDRKLAAAASVAQAGSVGADAAAGATGLADAWTAAPTAAIDPGAAHPGVPAIAREMVSPRDIIRAIRESQIAIKVSHAGEAIESGRRIWMFDETQGAFVAREPERMTILIDGRHSPDAAHHAAAEQTLDQPDDAANAAAAPPQASWFGTLRHLGRAAARTWFDI
jgi:Ca2+-binding RTX toxin-like protein